MHKLKLLQVKKLIKELEYFELDYEYKKELISEADNDFIKKTNDFLLKYPELKKLYDEILDQKIEYLIESNNISLSENFDNEIELDNSQIIISSSLKKLYREIAKQTHPDKTKEKKLNDIYIKSTNFYHLNDKIGLYKISDFLNIEFEIEENDDSFIQDKINEIKSKIEFIESTITWKWVNSSSDNEKNKIILDYIKAKMN